LQTLAKKIFRPKNLRQTKNFRTKIFLGRPSANHGHASFVTDDHELPAHLDQMKPAPRDFPNKGVPANLALHIPHGTPDHAAFFDGLCGKDRVAP
jgi:hypothetical protein